MGSHQFVRMPQLSCAPPAAMQTYCESLMTTTTLAERVKIYRRESNQILNHC